MSLHVFFYLSTSSEHSLLDVGSFLFFVYYFLFRFFFFENKFLLLASSIMIFKDLQRRV